MNNCKRAVGAFLLVLSCQLLAAQEPVRYREFRLGSDLATVAGLARVPFADAKPIHERPAVMKNLEWRPRYSSAGAIRAADPVDLVVFRFYEDQLFRIVVDYDPHRTEGMSEADMIEGIAATYGEPSKVFPRAARTGAPLYGAADASLAIWGGAETSITLVRVAYPSAFRLLVTDARLDSLARTAEAEAVRLDLREAPQRELDRQKQEAADTLAGQEKAKTENKAIFRP